MQQTHLLRSLFGCALIAMFGLSTAYADRNDGNRRDRGENPGRTAHPGHPNNPGQAGSPVKPGHLAKPSQAGNPGKRGTSHYVPAFHDPRWTLDSRFHHDHFYPRVGYTLSILPPGYLDIGFSNRHFFFSAGVWFRQEGARYAVVMPPVGIVIPILPPAYTTVWIGSTPYYYANGIYYQAANGGYVTVDAPQGYESGALVPPEQSAMSQDLPASPANDLLFVYPKQNQNDSQIASDRIECANWGTDKTGYDPTRAGLDDPRRGDYLRAVSACLEGRGYSVK